ncbi:LOW QUALITY PROTEIN: uncharacterized protein LOC116483169 [Hylobates moloch]|uniref:LOW QUALITY PROTEIN: uncharacterized protein LOC116483169 n=1 Tax=Hylobates moloch TaxID=81572 RepID=UPI00267718FD|nr:LOW QUALITY PROTEIN: uncharacterized protein LOC116483169 [Hylobates moloch]
MTRFCGRRSLPWASGAGPGRGGAGLGGTGPPPAPLPPRCGPAPEPPPAAPRLRMEAPAAADDRLWGLRGALPPDLRREAAELAALAGPVFLAQLMIFLISLVSSIFCGHPGKVELDAVTLAVTVGQGSASRSGAPTSTWLFPVCSWCALSGWPLRSETSLQVCQQFSRKLSSAWPVMSPEIPRKLQLCFFSLKFGQRQQQLKHLPVYIFNKHPSTSALELGRFESVKCLLASSTFGQSFLPGEAVLAVVAPLVDHEHIGTGRAGEQQVPHLEGLQKRSRPPRPLALMVVAGRSRRLCPSCGSRPIIVTPIDLWSGLIVCVFFQALFYLVYILRINWNKVVEQAQVQAGLKGNKETMPTSSDLPILGREVTEGIILPGIIRPESQTLLLMRPEENTQYAMSTAGEILTVRQLIFYCGMALAFAVTVLSAGIFIKRFQ